MSELRFRPVAALMLALHLAGCAQTWRPTANTPAEVLREHNTVRFTLKSGELVVVKDGKVRGDSIHVEGAKERCRVVAMQRTECTTPVSSVALSDVVETETLEASSGNIALLVIGAALMLWIGWKVQRVD